MKSLTSINLDRVTDWLLDYTKLVSTKGENLELWGTYPGVASPLKFYEFWEAM